MRFAPTRTGRLLLATVVAAICSTALVVGTISPADAAPRPAKVKDVRLKKPRVADGQASFTIKWDRAARARTYKVKWWPVPKTGTNKATTRNKSYVARGLAQGTTYCTKVRGLNGRTKGKWSKPACKVTPRLDAPSPVWMDSQSLQGGNRTALGIRWQGSAGAASYELEFAPGRGDVQKDKQKRTITLPASGAAVEGQTVGDFDSGAYYCFQIRAVNRFGTSRRSGQHCKLTMPASRGLPAGGIPLTVGTYNICSNVCRGQYAWSNRRDGVAQRVVDAGLDVVAFQEAGYPATDNLEQDLAGTHTLACQPGDGALQQPHEDLETTTRNQALFIRDDAWEVVPGTANGMKFPRVVATEEQPHGGCWVELQRPGSANQRVVVAVAHMAQYIGPKWDTIRTNQTTQLLAEIDQDLAARHPAGTAPDVVLLGDFNSHRSRATDGPREALEPRGYHDAYDVAARYLSEPFRNSAHGWSTIPATSWVWGDHLDRVFVPAGGHVASWEIVEPIGPDGTYTQLLSDHSMVKVSLVLQP